MVVAVEAFFDPATESVSYLAWDTASNMAAVVDPVLDYAANSGRVTSGSAGRIADAVKANNLTVAWVLDTHIHADHLTAMNVLKLWFGARTVIGSRVCEVQAHFASVYNLSADFPCDGSQFDLLVHDGDRLPLGTIEIEMLASPGHTPDHMTYRIGDALFVGDTLFMPDFGTARCDFPGGDARTLYRSVQQLLSLPGETRLFVCHDYGPDIGRDHAWETTVAAEADHNIHVRAGAAEAAFVAQRSERDATLDTPKLMLPAIQVNIRAGELPPPEANGRRYLKIPVE